MKPPAPDTPAQSEGKVGLFGATSIGIGGMVGGGIFAVLGVAATEAGGATPLAFLFAGIIAALTAYSYSKLSVRYQSAGGTVTFVNRVFGVDELTGTLNITLWAGYIATTALYAAAFGHYAATLFPGGEDPSPLLLKALILVGVLVPWIINLADAGLVARTEGIIVAIKLGILAVVVVAGVPTVSAERLEPATWPNPLAIVAAGMLIFVAYEGFELIANVSAEVRKPLRTLPWAFALSVGLVVVLYIAISVVVVGSLSPEEIVRTADFALAQAADASLGQVGFTMVAISAILATFSAINATLYGAARLSFTIASEGELPRELTTLRWNQPIGLHITMLAGLAMAVGLELVSIATLSSAIFLMVFAVVNAAAFKAAADLEANRIVTGLGVLGCIGSFLVLIAQAATQDIVALASLAALLGAALGLEHLYLEHRRKERIATDGPAD